MAQDNTLAVGKKMLDWTDKETNERHVGANLYVTGRADYTQGLFAGKYYIDKERNTDLYNKIVSQNLEKPVVCELVIGANIGSNKASLRDVIFS